MIVSVLAAAALFSGQATLRSTPDLGKAEGRCRSPEDGPSFLVSVEGLKDRRGLIKLEVYPDNDEDFLADDNKLVAAGKVFRRVEEPVPAAGPVQLCIRVPHAGKYAVSLLHDRDSQQEIRLVHRRHRLRRQSALGLVQAEGRCGQRDSRRRADADHHRDELSSRPVLVRPDREIALCGSSMSAPSTRPAGGGVKTYVERKLRAGPIAGHEIIVLAPGEQHGVRHFGRNARIVTIPAPRFPLDRSYRYFHDEATLHDALDQLRPDMVEVSSPWSSAAMVARWRGNAPRALIMHADPLAAYAYRWFGGIARRETIDRSFDWFWRHLRVLDQQFDLIVSASRDLARRLTEGGLGHVVTQPMGVEPGIFSPAHRSEALRAELLERCDHAQRCRTARRHRPAGAGKAVADGDRCRDGGGL